MRAFSMIKSQGPPKGHHNDHKITIASHEDHRNEVKDHKITIAAKVKVEDICDLVIAVTACREISGHKCRKS